MKLNSVDTCAKWNSWYFCAQNAANDEIRLFVLKSRPSVLNMVYKNEAATEDIRVDIPTDHLF